MIIEGCLAVLSRLWRATDLRCYMHELNELHLQSGPGQARRGSGLGWAGHFSKESTDGRCAGRPTQPLASLLVQVQYSIGITWQELRNWRDY
jgi:hypothetical protein